ncbi:hypothetical protein GALL_26590 [mine drainage metagenome]|uniref:Uncharacterized protein n=1 Tax=mine drainage metagenome TaxID=410659 RepID=A0A1J5T7J1_9ZZZZ
MSKDELLKHQMRDIIADLEARPNIWGAASVKAEPEKWLEAWQVLRVVKTNGFEDRFGLHFAGTNKADFNGAVSSKIETFDPVTMRGTTASGRVYQLVGIPGFSGDAQYVLDNWCRFNQVEVEIATDDFIEQCGISLDCISKKTEG